MFSAASRARLTFQFRWWRLVNGVEIAILLQSDAIGTSVLQIPWGKNTSDFSSTAMP